MFPLELKFKLMFTWQRIQTKYSHIAFISLRLPLLPSKCLHYLQPLLTWFGSEDPHVLIVPWDSILQMWDEQSRLNWILILDTLVQLKELTIALLFWQPKHVRTHIGLLSAKMLTLTFMVLLMKSHLSNCRTCSDNFWTQICDLMFIFCYIQPTPLASFRSVPAVSSALSMAMRSIFLNKIIVKNID